MTAYEWSQLLVPVIIALINAIAIIVVAKFNTPARSDSQEKETEAKNTPQENPTPEAVSTPTSAWLTQSRFGFACILFGLFSLCLIAVLFRELTTGTIAMLLMGAVYMNIGWQILWFGRR